MKILILDSYYEKMIYHIKKTYHDYPNSPEFLGNQSMYYGTGGSYNFYLNKLGFESRLMIMNAATDGKSNVHCLKYKSSFFPYYDAKYLNLPYKISKNFFNINKIIDNIKDFRPDIIFIQDLNYFSYNLLSYLKFSFPNTFFVGEIASNLPAEQIIKSYDLILSSLPNMVKKINAIGTKSIFFPLGFDPRINENLARNGKIYDVIFIGSFTSVHSNNLPLLRSLSKMNIDFRFFGKVKKSVIKTHNFRKNYGGEAWGKDMFQKLYNSRIVINRHSDLAEGYANNMRLFETTGVGSLLITESARNLSDYFIPEKEVIPYSCVDEIPNLVKGLLADNKHLSSVTNCGQEKTLVSHSYENRAKNFISILQSYV